MSDFPEHDKVSAVRDRSQVIGEFLDWLFSEKGYSIAEEHVHTDCHGELGTLCGYRQGAYVPVSATTRQLLAEYFEIDEAKLEAEKQLMLASLGSGT